ncbi:MAG TPA: glycoside hydrolase family 43 protein [Pyrinomonadaceae bacterium]|nr:glycoside hydrolase family 43 protein [Pyrinomonadaceae bacterium]
MRRFVQLALASLLFGALAAAQQPARRRGRDVRRERARAPATYANPVFDNDFPDPTVVRASDGFFYVYATQGPVGAATHNIQLARSRDLRRWERMPDAMPTKPAWASETQLFWAPDVHQRGRVFYMYFSGGLNPDLADRFKRDLARELGRELTEAERREGVFCLGVATSRKGAGPFRDSGKPIKCGLSFVNIDPMAFDDPATGRKYLYWGSGFQPIRVQELSSDRMSFRAGTRAVELVRADKNVPFQTLIEGAWVVRRQGWYYLFYSGENCCHGPLQEIKYAVMVARSRRPTGPFQTLAQATGAADSVILRRGERWIAPGHNSTFTDEAGQDWMAYHAIDVRRPYLDAAISGDRSVRRVMLVDRLTWRAGWPRVEAGRPSEGVRPAPVVR